MVLRDVLEEMSDEGLVPRLAALIKRGGGYEAFYSAGDEGKRISLVEVRFLIIGGVSRQ